MKLDIPKQRFLFHTGSIKRNPQGHPLNEQASFDSKLVRLKAQQLRACWILKIQFLFHTGSIKRYHLEKHAPMIVESFYSILVRLKVRQMASLARRIQSFYSILVRLKVAIKCPISVHFGSFYSILVRLKGRRGGLGLST